MILACRSDWRTRYIHFPTFATEVMWRMDWFEKKRASIKTYEAKKEKSMRF